MIVLVYMRTSPFRIHITPPPPTKISLSVFLEGVTGEDCPFDDDPVRVHVDECTGPKQALVSPRHLLSVKVKIR